MAYAAWTTPGDVLSKILTWIQLEQANFDDILANFLQKELVSDQYARLEQAGHSIEDPIPLAAVFTDLPAYHERLYEPKEEPSDLPPGFAAQIVEIAKSKFDAEMSAQAFAVARGRSGAQLGRYVLIGGPGQGKTTLGQYICQLFRVALLQPRSRLTVEARRALHHVVSQCRLDKTELPTARRFPTRIVLSEFAKALSAPEDSHARGLLSYIAKRISQRTGLDLSLKSFHKWLSLYPWVIVLDGLDEVPASSNRDQVLTAINDFWIDAAAAGADILVIATTRPQGYSYEFSPDFYTHKYLAPLSTARALHYGQRLVSIRYGDDADRQHRIRERLKRAANEPATVRLMRSPLQVTIMTTLVDKLGQPPEERWSLFRDYYKVIYDREVERDIPAATILRRYRTDIDAIHFQTGLTLQVESERVGKTDAKLTAAHFGQLVRSYLRGEGHRDAELEDLAANIIKAAGERLVFLVGLEQGQVGFEIRSLQEFMAAEGLMQGTDSLVRDRLRLIAALANWRAVFLFAAGKCYADRKHLRDTIYSIAAELNEEAVGRELSIVRAGSQLALDLLEDGSARSQPKQSQTLARLACNLMDLPPHHNHVRLGRMYQLDLDSVYREEIERRLSNVKTENRASAWICAAQLDDLEVNWATKLLLGATSIPDISSLLRAIDLGPVSGQLLAKVTDHVSDLAPIEIRRTYGTPTGDWLNRISAPWSAAVHNLAGYSRGLTKFYPILVDSKEALCNVRLRSMTKDWLHGIDKLPITNPAWKPYVASSKFLSAPSRATLSAALHAFSAAWEHSVRGFHLPWPIQACLGSARNAEDLQKLAVQAAEGHLGDEADWLAAERRWEKGIPLSETMEAPDAGVPFGPTIREFGFPLSASWGFDDIARSRLPKEIARIVALRPSPLRSALTYFAVEALVESNTNTPDSEMQLLLRAATDSWGINLAILNKVQNLDERWVETLDIIGHSAKIVFQRPDLHQSVAAFFQTEFVKKPDRTGLLRLIAEQAPHGAIPEVPSALTEVSRFDEPILRMSAITVRLAQSAVTESDVSELIKLNQQPEPTNQIIFHAFWKAVMTISSRTNSSKAIHVILRLLDAFQSDENYRTSLIDVLTEVLQRRKSNLSDPKISGELGLHIYSG